MNKVRKTIKLTFFAYLIGVVFLFGAPLEKLLLLAREQNIVDLLYQAKRDANVIDNLFNDFVKPEVKNAKAAGDTDAMVVYEAYSGTSTVQYRLWNGSAWGSPATTSEMYGTEVRHMQIRYAPTRDEAVLVALTNTGQVQAQIFNGTSWGTTTVLTTLNDTNTSGDGGSLYRGFDVEYEQSSGDAIVVAADGTADPNYYVWNGTSWASGVDINVPTTGRPYYIELAAPVATTTNDTLAMILIDSNTDVYGMRWTGSTWDNMGTSAVWDASGAIATEKSIDVAYEQVSGDIMFMWGDSVSTDQYYRTYSGTTLSAATLLDNPQAAGVCNWIKLAPNVASSTSDQIMYGVLDAGVNLNTFMWSGSAWSSVHTEHDTATENADAEMDFDIVFETHSSNTDDAWLLFNDGATISRKLWNGATQSWGTATTMGDDNNSIILNAHPNNGAVLALAYEDDSSATDDIREANLTGGSQTWSGIAQIWEGPVRRNTGMIRIAQATQTYNSSNEAMMAYITEDSTSYPQYKIWNGSSWGSQASTTPVNGEIRHMVLKTAPTRDEAILVTLGNNGRVEAQVWNGTSSSWGVATLLATMNNANGDRDLQSLYRGFDIEYENVSGDAVVVTGDSTADPDYYVWNGSTWTSGVDINIPTTGRPNWIELASRPGSDELAMIIQDANTDVYGMRWTGSAWDNMGDSAVWDATAAIATEKDIDVAFENASGDIMFIWGDVTSTDQYYRTYAASTLSSATLLDHAQAGAVNNWMKLVNNPASSTSNQIMYGVLDGGSDLNTYMWNDTAWSAVHTEHTAGAETNATMAFDLAFETHPSNMDDVWLAYGNGTTLSRKLWDGPTQAWGSAATQGDDTDYVVLNAHPNSGDMLMVAYESSAAASMDITENRLTGGSQTWGTASQIFNGPPLARTGLPLSKVTLASERYIEPTITQSGYRVFGNTDSTDVGSPLAALNTTSTLTSASSTFRVRALLHTDDGPILPSNKTFKLQFVDSGSGTCSVPSGGSPASYTDVTSATAIAFYNNATPSDGAVLTANANDPTHGGDTIVNQTYEEANNFTNSQGQIAVGADGMWDFSLIDYGGIPGSTYCLRIVESDGTVLDGYDQYPAIITYYSGGNSTPTITSVTESSDPVAAGATIYFNVDWNDTDSSYTQMFICKTNALSGSAPRQCTGGQWCRSVLTNRDPESCFYQTSLAEASTTPYNYYAFVCDDEDACSVSTSGTFTVSQQEPSAPTELLTVDMPNAFNVGSVTPYFSAIFNDPNIGDSANKYCIQVNTLANFTGTNLWYSDGGTCLTGSTMTTTTQGARSPDFTYAGTALNLNLATYYWRMWFWDQNGTRSATSSVTQFTMASGTDNVPQGVRIKGGEIKGSRLK